MAEFKLERFKYSWKGDWAGSTEYKRDDIVKVGGKSYVCLETHTSDTDFNVDLEAVVPGSNPPIPAPRWKVMTDSRSFVGTWAQGTAYQRGDIIQYDGSLWTCIKGHTSSNFEAESANWEIFASHIQFKQDWTQGDNYGPGAVVKYNGIVYKCIAPHTAGATIEDNESAWEVLHEGIEYAGLYAEGTTYRKNDLVKYGGSIWKCIETHVADPGLNEAKFDFLLPGFQYDGEWQEDVYYQQGDVVSYGGFLYFCTNNNINTDPYVPSNDSSNFWTLLSNSYNFRGDWSASANYRPGDIVERGGTLYLAKAEIGGYEADGSTLDYQESELWEVLTISQRWSRQTSAETLGAGAGGVITYTVTVVGPQPGDSPGNKYVLNGVYRDDITLVKGYTYVFNQDDLTNVYYPNDPAVDPGAYNPHPFNFSEDNIDGSLGGGTSFINAVIYYLDDTEVTEAEYNDFDRFKDATTRKVEIQVTESTPDLFYWCSRHTGMGASAVVSDPTDETGSWVAEREYKVGEIVYFYGTAYKCNTQHISDLQNFPGDNGSGIVFWDIVIERGSAAGLTKKGDLLTYNLDRTLQGDTSSFGPTNVPIGEVEQLLSVSEEQDVFWRDYIHDSDTIFVTERGMDLPGYGQSRFKPFRTIKHAAEFVLDNYSPLTPVKIYVSTGRYVEAGPIVVPAGCMIYGDELRSVTVVANDPLDGYKDDEYLYKKLYVQHFLTFVDNLLNNVDVTKTFGNNVVQDKSQDPAGALVANTIAELVVDHDNYLDYWLGSGVDNPTVLGTNTATTDPDYLSSIATLTNNTDFIIAEIKAWLTETYPDFAYDSYIVERDVRHFVRALKKDLEYTGNFYILQHTRDYKNRAQGSQFDDLFYMRDTTGLRNMTLTGLKGTLNPPGVFDLYQRPTGGSYASLDPSWGPDDNQAWINTRSPYIQGVTNIGDNCVGQKIDGALHNGGYKSMTSNDYTQVLSDGIGAWVANNGRAELVSVFTYYCQIGYLADAGGVIRATNGNNSYGTYGAIADGNDSTEVPQTVSVNNRNNQATIDAVFAGEFTDQIFAVEYSHCGEQYTEATAEIVGAGIDAQVEFSDFRDGGLFEVRRLPLQGSGALGGVGYAVDNGNAQSGNTTTITLESSSGFDEVDLLGRRIIIVSGDGTGQYGYITAYNNGTKVASVTRESDDVAGWDHIVPGTPIATSLTTNTQYRIEPRIEFTHPGFSSSSANLPQSRNIVDATFSDTTSEFTNITADPGTGTTLEVVAAPAVFNVTRVGLEYQVTFTDFGAGYAIGDTIVVSGSDLGGNSPENDLTITVTSTTDDSTNAIVTFSVEGEGIPGKFVWIATPNFAAYSSDASNWTETTLPAVANWRKIIAGNNRFVAIARENDIVATSLDGISWVAANLPELANWNDIAYGNGRFVMVADNTNTVAVSTDGITWTAQSIPDDLTGDSTVSAWQKVEYGQGKFVAVSGTNSVSATSTDGITWTRYYDLPVGTFTYEFFAFGNNRFLLTNSLNEVYYSLDAGETWTQANDLPTEDGSTVPNWTSLKYNNGLFVATADNQGLTIGDDVVSSGTTWFIVSEDGLSWTERAFPSGQQWSTTAYGVVNGVGHFVALAKFATLNAITKFITGARAKGRAALAAGSFSSVKIWDPGSGYDLNPLNAPVMTITDNAYTAELEYEIRVGNGVLAQPSWVNRGTGYRTSSTTVTLTGDGYADIYPDDSAFVTVNGVTVVPGPGAQIRFDGLLDEAGFDEKLFNAIIVNDLGDDGTGNNTKKVQFRLSPTLDAQFDIEHGREVTIRERYSQCRITNHDFLDIGTGNYEETNYPEIYAGGAYFVSAPENEVYEENGGRVFYTSSDQDGNFRAGELFSVQQATGIVTISADFFDLDGLSELALGGVRLGGSGAVVREFSTDPTFAEDSNNVVPTQRAIATFLANRLSVGGSDLETNALIAGRVYLGGADNEIGSTTGVNIKIPVMADFGGQSTILGVMRVMGHFLQTNNDSIQ